MYDLLFGYLFYILYICSMQEVVLQDSLGIGSHILITCAVGKTVRVNLRFNSTLAFGIKLSRYDDALSNTIVLYNFTLSAGDTVVDDTLYVLKENDQLIVDVSTNSVDYLLYYVETP